jgi:hypothetical protein
MLWIPDPSLGSLSAPYRLGDDEGNWPHNLGCGYPDLSDHRTAQSIQILVDRLWDRQEY